MLAKFILLCIEIIKDHAIVNSFHSRLFAIEHIEQILSFLDQLCNANRLNPQVILGTIKIDSCFLLVWFDLKQNCILRRNISHDHSFQISEVRSFIISIQVLREIFRNGKMFSYHLRIIYLESKKSRKSLHLY